MMSKVHVKKGDTVLVLSGKEGLRGVTGKIKAVMPKEGMVVIEGFNKIKRAVRPNPRNPQGGYIESEAPIHASKVTPICPSCQKPTRIRKKVLPDGTKARACAKCDGVLDTK
jgi:large subunit ribosomal protein L24